MGLIISSREEVQEYFDSDRLSQSGLKALLSGRQKFLDSREEPESERFYEEKGHFVLGKGLDSMMTGREGDFELDHYVSTLEKKPTDTEMSIVQQTFSFVLDMQRTEQETVPDSTLESFLLDNGNDLERYENEVLAACNDHGYQGRWKDETRVNKIMEVGNEYFKVLQQSHGKQILDQVQHTLLEDMKMSLTTDERTRQYFDREYQQRQENMDFYYQMPIYFEYKGIKCKALLDLVVVTKDETGKVVKIEPFDLKTLSGSTLYFTTSLRTRRYDIQAAWYTLALAEHFSIVKDDVKYTPVIGNFQFLVESTTSPGTPLRFRCDNSLLKMGTVGRMPLYVNATEDAMATPYEVRKELKGYIQLVDEYLWYEENGWDKDRVLVENPEVLNINWNDII